METNSCKSLQHKFKDTYTVDKTTDLNTHVHICVQVHICVHVHIVCYYTENNSATETTLQSESLRS